MPPCIFIFISVAVNQILAEGGPLYAAPIELPPPPVPPPQRSVKVPYPYPVMIPAPPPVYKTYPQQAPVAYQAYPSPQGLPQQISAYAWPTGASSQQYGYVLQNKRGKY